MACNHNDLPLYSCSSKLQINNAISPFILSRTKHTVAHKRVRMAAQRSSPFGQTEPMSPLQARGRFFQQNDSQPSSPPNQSTAALARTPRPSTNQPTQPALSPPPTKSLQSEFSTELNTSAATSIQNENAPPPANSERSRWILMWGVLPDSDSERVALAELQQGAGTVSDTRRPSLRSNFVFIQLENADAAERAVSRFNGVQLFFSDEWQIT